MEQTTTAAERPATTISALMEPGLVSPILTPFAPDLSIDHDRFAAHAADLLAQGCAGIAPFGTTGEGLSIGVEERLEGLRRLIDAGIDPARIVPGTGLTSLADTARLTAEVTDMGCAAAMVLPPFYYKGVPDDGLFAYFAGLIGAVARARLKICLYHIPPVAVIGLSADLVQRLRTAFPDQIVAIKDSSGDPETLKSFQAIDGLTVYPGAEHLAPEAIGRGAPGCISAMSNVNGPSLAAMVDAALAGRNDEARRLHRRVVAFRDVMVPYGPIMAMKWLLATRTGEEDWALVRPPLAPLPAATGGEIMAKLDALDAA